MKATSRFACYHLAVVLPAFIQSASSASAADIAELLEEAGRAATAGESELAVRLASQVVETDNSVAAAFYLRGREQFRLGRITAAVRDFDRYVELRPDLESRQWERGIAYYYAGKYEQGARQFQLYQSFHDGDVENSVWRFLCMVPTVGVERARRALLPIENDSRVPMMKIHDLFRGKLQPVDVLRAVGGGHPPPDVLAGRRFYAHLYLGLFHEATGDSKRARKYLALAADKALSSNRRINRYMWDVARIHFHRLQDDKTDT